jgi:23S rRNA maturation-related 3'-5' exoribonuclease YhaM
MTDLEQPPLSRAEVEHRLPTLALIDNDDLREETARLSSYAPAYFWERAGSTSGYHNAHEHGLWAHTLKLSTVIERMADSYVERSLLRPADVDRAHAAAILHDQLKAGEAGGDTRSDHDLLIGERIRRESEIDAAVARACEEHMGPWYDGPMPSSSLSRLVHVADMVASDDNVICKLQEPLPEEMRGLGFEGVALR